MPSSTEATSLVSSCKRIRFKLCLLMHLIHTGRAPQHLVDSVQSVTTSSQRHLRSSETTDYIKRTMRTKFSECGFSYSGSAAWSSLPSHVRTITDTNVFKRHLKAFLFTESFSYFLLVLWKTCITALYKSLIALYCNYEQYYDIYQYHCWWTSRHWFTGILNVETERLKAKI